MHTHILITYIETEKDRQMSQQNTFQYLLKIQMLTIKSKDMKYTAIQR